MPEHHATRVPTLLIGIGGIGGKIVREVDKALHHYDRQYVRMLVLDTNVNDLENVGKQNIPIIQTSENQTVSDYLRQNETFLEWFPTNPLINSKNLTQGAGQIRSVSRLGALASEDAHKFDKIKEAIQEINQNHGSTMHKMIRVMIVGSMSGGTGSGMGIQLPFLIRDQLKDIANMPRVIIRGLFVMPDIVEEKQDTEPKKKAVYVNSYSFLRELNGFYRAQTMSENAKKLNIEHYNPEDIDFRKDKTAMSHQVPYDFLFLVEKSDSEGQNIGNFDDYLVKAADIVKAQLFASQITADAHSTEDNLIVGLVDTNGMRRYCGAGVSKAIYPEAENIRYCTLRYTESILQNYWLQIDNMVAKNVAQHKKQMAVDSSLQPLNPQTEYCRVFDELTNPEIHEVSQQFGLLKRDISYESEITDSNGNKKMQSINCTENLVNEIQNFVEKAFDSPDIDEAEANCIPLSRMLDDPQKASSHVAEKLLSLKKFEKDANKRVASLTSSCIGAIIAADLGTAESYDSETKNPYSLYAVLKSKHPIVVRYLLYYVREKLLNQRVIHEATVSSLKQEENVFTTDYYKEKGGKDTSVEDPSYALSLVNPGVLSSLRIFSAEYSKLVRDIKKDFPAHVLRVKNLSKAKLCVAVYDGVIRRIDILIERLEKFFNELEKILILRQKERKSFENNRRIRNTNVYVCCDSDCREWFYQKFDNRVTDADQSLPDEIKTSFFKTIFGEYAKKLSKTINRTSFTEAEISMEKLFEDSILIPLTKQFEEKEFADMKLDIIQAIHLEYNIHKEQGKLRVNDVIITNPDYTKDDYFKAIATQIQELSRPYLAYTSVSQKVNRMILNNNYQDNTLGKILYFFGLNNNAVLEYQNSEKVDLGALNAMFDTSRGTTSAVNDDSFDDNELICYSSIYDFSIENFTKYRKGSKAYNEYMSRLHTIESCEYEVGTGEDDYLKSVHPHLDRNWHKHSYLPALCVDEELEMRKDIQKAFLLSIACNRCKFMERDLTKRWTYKRNGGRIFDTLTLNNEPATRGSYLTLYRVLDENNLVVQEILEDAEARVKAAYNNIRVYGIDLPTLLEHSIIKGFIGRTLHNEEKADFQKAFDNQSSNLSINIIDILFTVYRDCFNIELINRILQTLREYLMNYCMIMTNNQPGTSKMLYHEITKKIGDNHVLKLNDDFASICEDFVVIESTDEAN